MQALRGRLEEVLQIRETQAEMAELLGSQAGSSLVRVMWSLYVITVVLRRGLQDVLRCVGSCRSGTFRLRSQTT